MNPENNFTENQEVNTVEGLCETVKKHTRQISTLNNYVRGIVNGQFGDEFIAEVRTFMNYIDQRLESLENAVNEIKEHHASTDLIPKKVVFSTAAQNRVSRVESESERRTELIGQKSLPMLKENRGTELMEGRIENIERQMKRFVTRDELNRTLAQECRGIVKEAIRESEKERLVTRRQLSSSQQYTQQQNPQPPVQNFVYYQLVPSNDDIRKRPTTAPTNGSRSQRRLPRSPIQR